MPCRKMGRETSAGDIDGSWEIAYCWKRKPREDLEEQILLRQWKKRTCAWHWLVILDCAEVRLDESVLIDDDDVRRQKVSLDAFGLLGDLLLL